MNLFILLIIGAVFALFLRIFALSANRNLDRFVDQDIRSYPVKTNVNIFKGALLGWSSGYVRPLTAGDAFAGIAYEAADNTGGDNGDINVRVFTQGDFEHTLGSAAAANNNALVYASDDATLTLTANGNSYVGKQLGVTKTNTICLRLATTNVGVPAERDDLTQEDAVSFPLSLLDGVITGTGARLGAAAGTPSGAMAIAVGTHGSASPIIVGEAASGNAKTNKVRFLAALPENYVAGQDVTLRVRARVSVTATTSATVDATLHVSDKEAGVGADLVDTVAQALTNAFADKDFTITPTGLEPGDILVIELTTVVNDMGGTTGAIAQLGSVELLLDIKG